MIDLNRFLIGVCAPTLPALADLVRCYDESYTIIPLPEFSYILRFNRSTYSYYELDGRVAPDYAKIIKENLPVIRYQDPSDGMYEIVKFVSREAFPENSIAIYQYETPNEISTIPAQNVGYFYINLMCSYKYLAKRFLKNNNLLPGRPGFETGEQQLEEIYKQRKLLTRYAYKEQMDTLILGTAYENEKVGTLVETIYNFLFVIDSVEKAVGPSKKGGMRLAMFHCIANKEETDKEELKHE